MKNDLRLFYGSCFALISTAFSFAIYAGILPQLGDAFGLTATQLGFITSMWFLGFPISMVLGGLFYHAIGPKKIMQFAFFSHTTGILLAIFSGGYTGLLIATLLIGIGNGCTEAACNPMIADSYTGKRMNTLLNRFHMWFPGGIVVGSLSSQLLTSLSLGWQVQMAYILIPTVIYAYLFFGQVFPKPRISGDSAIIDNVKACINPLFIFMVICMAFTAISEFGPSQWTSLILSQSGAPPLVLLALGTGTMAIGRYFGGDLVHKFDQTGVLLGSAVLTLLGIYLYSTQTGAVVYLTAIIYGAGVCYFWPNMIGFIAEKIPKSGALGMSILGAMGMFSTAIFQPVIGGWIDSANSDLSTSGLTGDALELAVGQTTMTYMLSFPGILIIAFVILYFWQKKITT